MNRHELNANEFVAAVHRRLVLLRALEHIGRGLFAASILAVVLIAVAIWQSMPTGQILLFCGGLGLLAGIGTMTARLPTRLTTAMEIDKQLRLDDLLASAIFSTGEDEFTQTVRAIATARCRLHIPSEVILRQFGIRRWSGIALTMSIAVILAVIPLGPTRSNATDSNIAILSSNPGEVAMQQGHGPVAATNDPIDENASNAAMTNAAPTDKKAGEAGGHKGDHPDASGIGGGSSNSAASSHPDLQIANTVSHSQNTAGDTAGGGNSSGIKDHQGDHAGGKTAGNQANSTPSWTGGNAVDSRSSTSMIDDKIPAEDRDLVRDFFNHR